MTDDTTAASLRSLNDRLVAALKPFAAPLAISFHAPGDAPTAPRVEPRYPEPNEHGRAGQIPAGCVFWIQGATDTFATVAADHANCSVGSYTHGFITLEDAATKDDVGAVLEATGPFAGGRVSWYRGVAGLRHCQRSLERGVILDRTVDHNMSRARQPASAVSFQMD